MSDATSHRAYADVVHVKGGRWFAGTITTYSRDGYEILAASAFDGHARWGNDLPDEWPGATSEQRRVWIPVHSIDYVEHAS